MDNVTRDHVSIKSRGSRFEEPTPTGDPLLKKGFSALRTPLLISPKHFYIFSVDESLGPFIAGVRHLSAGQFLRLSRTIFYRGSAAAVASFALLKFCAYWRLMLLLRFVFPRGR
jgi:hypothetical protein